MIRGLHGIPGSGKNVLATYEARKHFKRENNIIFKIIRRINHEPVILNNVYSSYPIKLKHYISKKKSDIYSNRVTIFDLTPKHKFKENALIIIDEVQSIFDSEEHKEFPKDIATFNQFHRHFDIKDIIYITQHPSRLMKKLRILCNEFDKVNTFIKLPLLPIGFMHIIEYYEFDDYGKWHHPKKEAKTYDVKNTYKLFLTTPVFKAFNSKYMAILNYNSPVYDKGTYSSCLFKDYEINYIFRDRL